MIPQTYKGIMLRHGYFVSQPGFETEALKILVFDAQAGVEVCREFLLEANNFTYVKQLHTWTGVTMENTAGTLWLYSTNKDAPLARLAKQSDQGCFPSQLQISYISRVRMTEPNTTIKERKAWPVWRYPE